MEMINLAPPTLTEEDLLRAEIYALLARLCRQHPDQTLLEWLSGMEESSDAGEMASAWRLLRLAAGRARTEQLEDEYLNLFIGITQGELTPFASWYLTGSLMEAPLIELRTDLQLLGFARQADVHEPEDHIAALLEVMSLLIQQGASRERQVVFFQRHLSSWAERLFKDMENAPSAVFYHAVALLGQAFIRVENLHLQKRPDAVQRVCLRG